MDKDLKKLLIDLKERRNVIIVRLVGGTNASFSIGTITKVREDHIILQEQTTNANHMIPLHKIESVDY